PGGGGGGGGAGGLFLVPPRPGPASGVRLDGDAPERGPPDLPDHRRGVRGARPATGDLAGWRPGSGAARGPPRRSGRGRVRAATGPDPAVGPDDLARRAEHGARVAGAGRADGRPAGGLRSAGVGARVEGSGVGRSIPAGRLTVDRLRDAVRIVLGSPAYRARAARLQSSIEAADGLN